MPQANSMMSMPRSTSPARPKDFAVFGGDGRAPDHPCGHFISARNLFISLARRMAGCRPRAGNAAFAALTASSTSALDDRLTLPAPLAGGVAGLKTSCARPLVLDAKRPPIKLPIEPLLARSIEEVQNRLIPSNPDRTIIRHIVQRTRLYFRNGKWRFC